MIDALVIANDLVGERMAGPAIRALELSRAIHGAGLSVALAVPGPVASSEAFPLLSYDTPGRRLREAAAEAKAIVAQGLVLSHYPFLAAMDRPLVIDIYDPFVLENLAARAHQTRPTRTRSHWSDLEALVGQLRRGDFFVCASERQRDYWLGLLTALGRVNPATYDADPSLRRLIDVVPFGLPEQPPGAAGPAARGVLPGIDGGSFLVLWGGGIWNWLDPLTLIRAVAEVATDRPELRLLFMGTGAPTRFPPDTSMSGRARSLAAELGLLGRVVHFDPGWIPYGQRAGHLLEADVGVSFHQPHIETHFAFRTRIMDYIWAGLPMLVTGGDVLADLVCREGLGEVVPPGDVGATVKALRALLERPGGKSAYAEAFARLRPAMTWSRAAEPLLGFLRQPRRAPDTPPATAGVVDVPATTWRQLPRRSLEVLREGGPLLLAEEAIRYLRWLRRGR